jgi:hypothetical protein
MKRLKWTAYVKRMEDYCIPKKISGGGSFRGKRPVG